MAIASRSPHTTERRSTYIAYEFDDARQSDTRIVPHLDEPDTEAAARGQTSQSARVPVMVSKSHVFEGMPDVANIFVSRHLIHRDPDITAKHLRTYARISLAHRNEVAALFQQTHMRDVQFCSTRNALPSLLKDAKAAGKDQVSEQAIAALLEAAPCLYANVSWPVLRFGRSVGKLRQKILSHPDLREVRLDMSGPTERQIKGVTTSEEAKQSARATDIEAHALHPEVYKGLRQRKASAPLKIDFIYRRTLKESLLASTLEKLRPFCKIGQGIFLQSIDLSDPVGKTSHIESSSFQLWNVAPAFLENMTQWIGAADSAISVVKLGGMNLGEGKLIQIANAMYQSSNQLLREVDLSGNRIRKIGATKLAEALAVNPYLIILNLQHNQIEDTGAAALYRALQQNKILHALHLGDNSISPDHLIWNDGRVSGRPAS